MLHGVGESRNKSFYLLVPDRTGCPDHDVFPLLDHTTSPLHGKPSEDGTLFRIRTIRGTLGNGRAFRLPDLARQPPCDPVTFCSTEKEPGKIPWRERPADGGRSWDYTVSVMRVMSARMPVLEKK